MTRTGLLCIRMKVGPRLSAKNISCGGVGSGLGQYLISIRTGHLEQLADRTAVVADVSKHASPRRAGFDACWDVSAVYEMGAKSALLHFLCFRIKVLDLVRTRLLTTLAADAFFAVDQHDTIASLVRRARRAHLDASGVAAVLAG